MVKQMNLMSKTPSDDGFWMPGEFAPHERCWMLWPQRPDVWRNEAGPAQQVFAEVAATIGRFEPVTMGVPPDQLPHARTLLPESVTLQPFTYNDAWMRDNGPTFVINQNGERRGIDWTFNAWGQLYPHFAEDDRLAEQLLSHLNFGRYRCPLVTEGGAIDVDGEGTLIVTEQSLLDPARNPNRTRNEVELLLRTYLNVQKVIWLQNGVYNDETAGHIDNLCCFVRPGVVALSWTEDSADPQYAISRAAYAILRQSKDAVGRPLEIHLIHQPTPMYMTADEVEGLSPTPTHRYTKKRLAGSYINYYVANGGVIAPIFDDKQDAPALATLQKLFPDREVVGIYAREILLGGGNIHCITQQQPLPITQ